MKLSYLKQARKWSHSQFVALSNRDRDSRYVFVLIFSTLIFILTSLQALNNGLFDSIERPIFKVVNNLPVGLSDVMFAVTQLGGLGSLLIWCGVAWYLVNKRCARTVLASGIVAWFIAKVAKVAIHRGRPGALLDDIQHFSHETLGGYGFPSGHSTLAAACATVLYYQTPRRFRKYYLLAVLLVGISRMYLGAHFPLDVVGGWALGMMIGSITMLALGSSTNKLSPQTLKKILRLKGYDVATLHFAQVDARGSRPFFMEDASGNKYFAKIFGQQEHAADWLFKIYRFFRYKNLQAEEPYLNSKRNVELESLATLWAGGSGARVAKIVDLVQARSLWILIQERVDGIAMADHKRIRKESLENAWEQVELLHASRLAHRDLRASNLLIDKKGKVWVIDFGFAEVSARKTRMYMDVAELLMSMSLIVGVERAVDSAFKILPPEKLTRTLPYLQKAVFSGATSKQLKENKHILDDLKNEIRSKLGIEEEVETADILRLNLRKFINITLLATFFYIILPQFKLFGGTINTLSNISIFWLSLALAASALTYFFTAWVYISLADVPLRTLTATIVQLAASFVAKVLPGGIGSTTINARYLSRAGMDSTGITALLVSQGVIGFITFVIPLSLFLFFNGTEAASLMPRQLKLSYLLGLIAVLFLILVALAVFKKLRIKVMAKTTKFISELRDISAEPRDISYATIASILVTASYVFCLYASAQAIGLEIGIGVAILVYASAVIAKSAIPTPGGLGPLEVAMVAALAGLGYARPESFAVVVLYRLATFWLPIPFSFWAYRYINKKKLI